MNNSFLLTLIFILTSIQSFGQSKILDKIEVGIQLGANKPVGHFARVDIENSLDPNFINEHIHIYREVRGFIKNQGGQARLGRIYGANLTYHLSNALAISIHFANANNPINVTPQVRYFEENLQNRVDAWGNEYQIFGSLYSENYSSTLLFSGITWKKELNNWVLSITGYGGVNRLDFPFYSWSFVSTGLIPTILRPAQLDIPIPATMPSLLLGLGTKISKPLSKNLNINLETRYFRSNHDHTYWNLMFVGCCGYKIEDEIKVRMITLETGVSYRFSY